MKVYQRTAEPRPRSSMLVTPGDGFGEFSNKTMEIIFIDGRAEVPDNIGRWMIETERASSFRQRIIQATRELICPTP